MGDMMTLIEQAEKAFDQDQAMKAAQKLSGQGGEFTLDDFLEQMQQVRKLGSMSKIIGMLPGMGQMRDQLENFDEREIDRIQADHPVDDARRAGQPEDDRRLPPGPDRQGLRARQVSDVNSLVDRFFEARKMMMQMARGGGMPGMPGMPGAPGGGKRAKAKQQAKKGKGKRRVSGNPAKAAAAGGRRARRRPPPPAPTRSATPTARRSTTRRPPPTLQLPKDFSKFLK